MEGLSIFGISLLIPGLIALAVIVFGLGLYAWRRQQRIVSEARKMEAYKLSPQDELKTLGIVSVRRLEEEQYDQEINPMGEMGGDDSVQLAFMAEGARRRRKPAATADNRDGLIDDKGDEANKLRRFAPERTRDATESADSAGSRRHPGTYLDEKSTLWNPSLSDADTDAVAFLLESLWAAIGAQNVALLRFDEAIASYAVEALVSDRVKGQINLFPAGGNLPEHVLNAPSISVLEPNAFYALRYHENPMVTVGHAIAIAVAGPADQVLLVADVGPDADSFRAAALERFGAYAGLLASFLPGVSGTSRSPSNKRKKKSRSEVSSGSGRSKSKNSDVATVVGNITEETSKVDVNEVGRPPLDRELKTNAGEDHHSSEEARALNTAGGSNGSYRSRNEIIAEEMAAARATEEPLALALVVPYDAVELATKSTGVVRSSENELIERLQGIPGSKRIELFGELVIGVFCKAGPAFVEAWAERVQESGPDVHIGIAFLRARHRTSEAFRADAERALREAYERQEECVIVD